MAGLEESDAVIAKHLATFNLFREADHSLHITIADAQGVREELGESNAPLHLCTMNALYTAVELHRSRASSPIASTPPVTVEQLGAALFVLSHHLKSRLTENSATHKAYEKVIAAFNTLAPARASSGPFAITAAPRYSWWAAEGDMPEMYHINAATREEVIAAAIGDYGRDATFTIVEATQDGPFNTDIFDDPVEMERLGDRFSEANEDRWGEDGWDGWGATDAEEQELAAALSATFAAWIDKRSFPTWSFTHSRNKETIVPRQDTGEA